MFSNLKFFLILYIFLIILRRRTSKPCTGEQMAEQIHCVKAHTKPLLQMYQHGPKSLWAAALMISTKYPLNIYIPNKNILHEIDLKKKSIRSAIRPRRSPGTPARVCGGASISFRPGHVFGPPTYLPWLIIFGIMTFFSPILFACLSLS